MRAADSQTTLCAHTPDMVERVCGVRQERFQTVAEAILANSGRDRTTSFAYAVAWTQHSVGVQIIRAAAILQQLLGNIGGRAAASSRRGVTPASRAAPISRPSTTFCPGTSHSQTSSRTTAGAARMGRCANQSKD